jgi:ankyrin repeat protein
MDGALYQAAENGHEAVVQLLLKHMVDVDANDDGRTALRWAAENGFEAEVRPLLKHKVDVGAKTVSGKTALYLAAEMGTGSGAAATEAHGGC